MSETILNKMGLELGMTINGLPIGSLDLKFSLDDSAERGFLGNVVVDFLVGVVSTAVNEVADVAQEAIEFVATEITTSQIFNAITAGINNILTTGAIIDDGWAEMRESSKFFILFF